MAAAGGHPLPKPLINEESEDTMSSCEEVKELIGNVLQIGERVQRFDRGTALLGAIPEFDSMAVVSLLTALEDHFGIVVDDDEINAEMFETVGRLCDFVDGKLSG